MTPDKRKALGRGLGALLPEAPPPGTMSAPPRRDYFTVGIEEVAPSGANPRQRFDEAALDELAASIREKGLLQPLLVRTRAPSEGGGFVLIAGERRWRAAQRAGLKSVPVVVREASPREAFELALVENLQRADLNPIEEAEGYRRLCDEFALTQDQVAQRVGKDRATVSNALRLLRLPGEVREMVVGGSIQMGHARALLGLDTVDATLAAARKVADKKLSVRETEELVRRERAPRAAKVTTAPTAIGKSASVRDLERRLERALGTHVRVVEKGAGAGRIEVDYASLDELDRIIEKLLED